jgi:energy-coupling factor transporter ATP-binding protein EcfA2
MADGFIKNYDLIQETSHVDDLLDFSKSVSAFSKRLESIGRPAIIGLVGRFGSGKSTMLYQINRLREQEETWVNFDAWKYPERKDLWEGFVLDLACHLGMRKKVIGRIEARSCHCQRHSQRPFCSASRPGFSWGNT